MFSGFFVFISLFYPCVHFSSIKCIQSTDGFHNISFDYTSAFCSFNSTFCFCSVSLFVCLSFYDVWKEICLNIKHSNFSCFISFSFLFHYYLLTVSHIFFSSSMCRGIYSIHDNDLTLAHRNRHSDRDSSATRIQWEWMPVHPTFSFALTLPTLSLGHCLAAEAVTRAKCLGVCNAINIHFQINSVKASGEQTKCQASSWYSSIIIIE